VLEPLLKEVESITEKIKDSDREIEQIARKDYPETALLQQVGGVGPIDEHAALRCSGRHSRQFEFWTDHQHAEWLRRAAGPVRAPAGVLTLRPGHSKLGAS
jgi:hypothetical protein